MYNILNLPNRSNHNLITDGQIHFLVIMQNSKAKWYVPITTNWYLIFPHQFTKQAKLHCGLRHWPPNGYVEWLTVFPQRVGFQLFGKVKNFQLAKKTKPTHCKGPPKWLHDCYETGLSIFSMVGFLHTI